MRSAGCRQESRSRRLTLLALMLAALLSDTESQVSCSLQAKAQELNALKALLLEEDEAGVDAFTATGNLWLVRC